MRSMLSPSVFVVTKSAENCGLYSPERTLTGWFCFIYTTRNCFFFIHKGSVRIESWGDKGQLSRWLLKVAFYSVVHAAAAVHARQRGSSPTLTSLDLMTKAHWVLSGTWILGNTGILPSDNTVFMCQSFFFFLREAVNRGWIVGFSGCLWA